MKITKFVAKDLDRLIEQEATAYLRPYITSEHMDALAKCDYAFTGRVDDRVIICGGITEYWPGRGEAWAFIDQDCRAFFYSIHKAAKRFLDVCPMRRIEATVDVGFIAGHRWVQALGFNLEASMMKAHRPDGGDSALYARVRRN